MSTLNLIPAPRVRARAVKRRRRFWVRAFSGLAIALAVLYAAVLTRSVSTARETRDLRARHETLQLEIRGAEQLIQEHIRLVAGWQSGGTRVTAPTAARYLAVMSAALDSATRLEFLKLESERAPGGETAEARVKLTIRGIAPDHLALGAFIGRLRSSGGFERVTLIESHDRAPEGAAIGRDGEAARALVGFELACRNRGDSADG